MNTRIRHFIKSSKSWPKAVWSWCKALNLIKRLLFCAVAVIILAALIAYSGGHYAETIRNAILIIGGLMAFYGLVQATKRQETFAEQVDTQIKQAKTAETQLFNDRLGRGVELLANSDKMLSKAGIRVLEDLANSVDVIEHKKIIANLLHDFIRGRTAIIYQDDKDGKMAPVPVSRGVDRSDVQLALDVYLGLTILPPMNKLNKDFSHLDLSYLNFSSFNVPDNHKNRRLHDIKFRATILNHCILTNVELVTCIFSNKLPTIQSLEIFLGSLNLNQCLFEGEFSVTGTSTFDNMPSKFNRCVFRGAHMNITNAKVIFLRSLFPEGCTIRSYGKTSIDFFGTDISSVSLGKSRNTSSNINALKAIYREGRVSESFTTLAKGGVDKSRAYLKIGLRKYFIKSDAEWSEKPVDEWIEEEIRQWEREEIEESQAEIQAEH